MTSPRFWPRWARASAVVGALLVPSLVLLIWELNRQPDVVEAIITTAPVVGALVALSSLVLSAIGLSQSRVRQQRESTIKAWVDWSQGTLEHRLELTRRCGDKALTDDQVRQIMSESEQGLTPPNQLPTKILIRTILNGLERICVGIEQGVYDLDTLTKLGGTITVRTYYRTLKYITAIRTQSNDGMAQKTAYVSLEYVCNLLDKRELKARSKKIDQDLLTYMRNGTVSR